MLGIVLLNYKNYKETINCIESINNNNIQIPYCVYVIDNCSPNESYEVLKDKYGNHNNIKVVKNENNNGFSAGNNVGFKLAIKDGCDYILCTNTDVIFRENCINILYNELKSDVNCAVIGPKVFCPDGSIQNANKGILDAKTFLLRKKGFRIFDWTGLNKKYTYADYDYSKPLILSGMVSGCCFMIRASVLENIDYLDENVFLYHEEDILGAKIRNTNKYYVKLFPNAEIIHKGGASTSESENAFTRFHKMRSGMYFLWVYTNTSLIQYNALKNCFILMFNAIGIVKKEYRKSGKKLNKELAMIPKNYEKYKI